MAKSQEEQYSEFSKKFNQLLEQFRSQNKDITVLKDILQKQLEYDTTLAGQRTPRARAEKRDRDVVDKKQLKHITEQQKLFKKMNKDLNSINKNMDKFVKSEQSRAKIFGKTLQEGLKEDLKDVLSPLLGIGDLPFIRSIKDATVAAFKGQKDLSDKSKAQLESSEKATAAMDSIDQMTADIRDMLADIHSHFVGGPTPSEKREMELEKKRLALKQKETVTSKDADAGKQRDGEAEFDIAEVVETAMGVGFGQLLGKGLVSAFGTVAGMAMWTKVAGVFAVAMKSLGVIGVALAAFFTGKFLYEHLIAPWLDEYFERSNDEFAKKESKGFRGVGEVEETGDFFMRDQETGKETLGTKEEAEKFAKKHGMTLEEAQEKGIVRSRKIAPGRVGQDETPEEAQERVTAKEEGTEKEKFIQRVKDLADIETNKIGSLIDEHGLDSDHVVQQVMGSAFRQYVRLHNIGEDQFDMNFNEIMKPFGEELISRINEEGASGQAAKLIFSALIRSMKGKGGGGMDDLQIASKDGTIHLHPLYQSLEGKVRSKLKKGAIEFAKGGLVSGPVNALIGEAGPEVVMPLRDSASVIGKSLVEAQRQAPLLGVIPQFGPMGDMPDDLGLNALIKGGAFGAPGRGQGGQQIIAPSFSNPTTNSTVVNNINNGLPDHPAFMQERRDRNDSFLWAGL
jgi:hypothetical protein